MKWISKEYHIFYRRLFYMRSELWQIESTYSKTRKPEYLIRMKGILKKKTLKYMVIHFWKIDICIDNDVLPF